MGFSANTHVLTSAGYKPIASLSEGDLLPTPLGETQVVKVTEVTCRRFSPVTALGRSVVVLGCQRFLSKTPPAWQPVVNLKDCTQALLTGYLNNLEHQYIPEETLPPDSLYSFIEPTPVVYASEPFLYPSWFELETANHLAVVGTFITLAVVNHPPILDLAWIPGDVDTTDGPDSLARVLTTDDLTLFARSGKKYWDEPRPACLGEQGYPQRYASFFN